MKIIYSPFYDGDTYLGDLPKVMGATYVGNMGLLDQLQLRAGIHLNPKPDVEREAEYRNAMMSHIKGTIFEEAADVDPMGVAAKLLQWRDALIMAGWDGTCNNSEAVKVNVLACIENDFKAKGIADCWRKICEEYNETNHLCGCVEEIRVDSPWSEIPYLIQQTIQSVGNCGTTVNRTVNENENFPTLNIDNLKLVEFDDVNDAYEWFAQIKELPADTAIINRDNVRLNHTLYTWDSPQVHSTLTGSNPQLLQLFKLSMSIFSRPLNIQNLVSYLMLPVSPIPGKLRYSLARLLLSKGGFGEKKAQEDDTDSKDWDGIIDSFEFMDNKGKPTRQTKAKKMRFLNPIREDYTSGIIKKDIIDYVEALKEWVRGHYANKELPQARKEQFHQLSTYLNSFSSALQALPEIIEYCNIEQLILQIYRPMNYSLQAAEVGSRNVITDINALAKGAGTLIWLDCQDEDTESDSYDFLSSTERNYLLSNGCSIPDFAKHLQRCRAERIRLVNTCVNIILVRSFFDGTTRLGEHSMIAEARYAFAEAKKKLEVSNPSDLFTMIEKISSEDDVEIYSSVKALELGKIEYKGRKESNTSLDTLINLPFNYVMEYVARLPKPDEEQIKSLYVTTGLVAHHFFEHVIDDAGADYVKMRNITHEEFDQRLKAAIDATGLIMRLEENASSLNEFREQLKASMLALVDIMEKKQWLPVGCEINFPKDKNAILELDEIGNFGARIDFVLKNTKGDYVIIDFKWSYSNKYGEYLENNAAIQLELYKQAVLSTYTGKKVVGVGYYLMPKKQLLTTDFDEIPHSRLIKHIEPKDTSKLFEQIKKSYEFRMAEIKRGHIEEAEMMDILGDSGTYYSMIEDKNLCPLKVKEKTAGRGANKTLVSATKESENVFKPSKKISFEKENLEPSEVATSHPILKGRLK